MSGFESGGLKLKPLVRLFQGPGRSSTYPRYREESEKRLHLILFALPCMYVRYTSYRSFPWCSLMLHPDYPRKVSVQLAMRLASKGELSWPWPWSWCDRWWWWLNSLLYIAAVQIWKCNNLPQSQCLGTVGRSDSSQDRGENLPVNPAASQDSSLKVRAQGVGTWKSGFGQRKG